MTKALSYAQSQALARVPADYGEVNTFPSQTQRTLDNLLKRGLIERDVATNRYGRLVWVYRRVAAVD